MRKARLIDGLNNSQRIRIIVNGVGFYTTVGGTENICTRDHRMAVQTALMNLAHDRYQASNRRQPQPVGFGFNYQIDNQTYVSTQVDLV